MRAALAEIELVASEQKDDGAIEIDLIAPAYRGQARSHNNAIKPITMGAGLPRD